MPEELNARDIENILRDELGVKKGLEILAFVNYPAIGPVRGGPEAVASALLAAARTVLMPAFTYQTQIIPQVGPPDNAMEYGIGDKLNTRAEIFRPDLAVHPDCGTVAEALRKDAETFRSTHPILSFIAQGLDAKAALSSQTRQNPLGPIAWLEARDGAVLLVGHDQRVNFALHLAEQRAGRKTFTRWALTLDDVEELPGIPGCMEGFNAIWRMMKDFTSVGQVGMARTELIPVREMLQLAEELLAVRPNFLLCDKPSCISCRTRER